MRELIADLFITVDGYASGRESPAFFGYPGRELDIWIDQELSSPHTMVMGANTYRVLADIITSATDANSARMTELPKLVFSRSLRPPLEWANSTVIADDIADAVPNLKQQDGDQPQPASARPGRPAAADGVPADPRRLRRATDLRGAAGRQARPDRSQYARRPAGIARIRAAATRPALIQPRCARLYR